MPLTVGAQNGLLQFMMRIIRRGCLYGFVKRMTRKGAGVAFDDQLRVFLPNDDVDRAKARFLQEFLEQLDK